MHASETKLQSILEGTKQYMVPLFQRPYSWEKPQWETLWNDILELMDQETIRPHFLGSIVTLPTNSVPEGVQKFLLIDGQQRLTTIFILLAVIRDRAQPHEETNLAQKINNKILVNQYEKDGDYYKLQPTQADRQTFYQVIKSNINPDQDHQIFNCYRFFQKQIKPSMDLNQLFKVIVSSLSLVSIVLSPDENPHLVFESLNAKGKLLSQADLIRNYFFMRIHIDQQDQIYAQYWTPMQESLGEGLTECIRHYLMKDGMTVRQNDVYLTLKEKIDKKEIIACLQELTRFTEHYTKLINPELEKNATIRYFLLRINRLEVTTIYPFLLNCYDDYAHNQLTANEFVEVLKVLENYLIRRFVCNLGTNTLNKLFPGLYNQINQRGEGTFLARLKSVIPAKSYPKDHNFKESLLTVDLYSSLARKEKCKLILEAIELFYQHREQVPFSNLTIEHIMPQTLTKEWKNHLGEEWAITHDLLLDTIGNLTLTAYNPELYNSNFQKKRQILLESHLELNKYFAEQTTWQKEDIEKRSRYLAEIALKIWPYFGDPDSQAEDQDDVTGKKPKALYIKDKKYPVKSWRDVMEETVNFIIAEFDANIFEQLIQRYPRFLNWNHPDLAGDTRELSNGAYMYVGLSAKDIYSFCIKVIETAELTADDWRVVLVD